MKTEDEPLQVEIVEFQPVVVDYNMSVVDMIRAGKYDGVEKEDEAALIQLKGSGLFEFRPKLLVFSRSPSILEVWKEMEKRSFEAGMLEHMLAFGAQIPNEQREANCVMSLAWYEPNGWLGRPRFYGDEKRRSLDWDWAHFRQDDKPLCSKYLAFTK